MFDSLKRKREEDLLRKLAMIKPTSKSELKQSCLLLANMDIDKAKKMYDFLVADMTEIPEVPPTQKSFIQNFGEQASGVFGWIRENQDIISQGVDLIKGFISKKPTNPPTPLPPING